MTMQADSAPLIFLLVIVASVINWIVRGIKEKAGEQEPPRDTVRPSQGNSEEERVRKFLEALGVPNDAPPPPPPRPAAAPPQPPLIASAPAPATPPPLRENQPAPQPTGRRFSPPPMMPSPGFPRKGMTRLPPEPTPEPIREAGKNEHPWLPRTPRAEEELQEPGFPKRAATASSSARSSVGTEVEAFGIAPEEALPSMKLGLETITSASSSPQLASESGSGTGTSPAQWAALLKDRQALRRAIVLREIIGPPRSLQSVS